MNESRTHPSFVRYIDKSREYYRASGYDQPYRWAHHDDVPFQSLTKPLAESRIGVVTTADKAVGDVPRSAALFASPLAEAGGLYRDKFWDREATHTDDVETYLPLSRLGEYVETGRIGALSSRFYGVPTDYSQRLTNEDALTIAEWMREDEVDAAILVPL